MLVRGLGAFSTRLLEVSLQTRRFSMQPLLSRAASYPGSDKNTSDRQMSLNNLAITYLQKEGSEALKLAENILLQGLALNAEHFTLNYNLGCVYANSDLEKSLAHFKKAHELRPKQQFAKNNYLITLHKLVMRAKEAGDYQSAHQYVDKLMAYEEYEDYARLEKSRLYESQGKVDEAKRWKQIALEINPYLESLIIPAKFEI